MPDAGTERGREVFTLSLSACSALRSGERLKVSGGKHTLSEAELDAFVSAKIFKIIVFF